MTLYYRSSTYTTATAYYNTVEAGEDNNYEHACSQF